MDTATSLKLQQLPHPPYSPDLAPSDFFGALKQRLKGKAHLGAQELLAAVTAELTQITGDVLFSVFEEWKARLHAVIENGGEYIIK